jgi:hypothetical protein
MATDHYHSFMLRIWHVEDDGEHLRALLEDVETGKRHGFASIAKLIEFLMKLDGGEQGMPDIADQ